MKRVAVLLLAMLTALFGGCAVFQISEESTSAVAPEEHTTTIVVAVPGVSESAPEEGTTAEIVGTTAAPEETAATPEVTTYEQTTVREDKPAKEERTTREEKTTAKASGEVELSISMPEKNGTMKTDDSPDNKYIRIVNKKKKVDKELLLAVFSVPESGQNYVFEFYDAKDADADNIRRVYLIDSYGDIISVAATESNERENISPVENWFCMNVLIKEIIYPAVAG
jgi:hypothetical protein